MERKITKNVLETFLNPDVSQLFNIQEMIDNVLNIKTDVT